MPFSSGQFSRVYNWVTDKNNSIDITASRVDTEDNGFATGLSTCLLKDGTQTVTANIPFAGFKLTGVGSGTAATDVANVGQVQSQLFTWIAAGGTADAITATYSPAVTSLVDGMELDFRATAANATTTPTFSPSGLTPHVITQNGGTALVANNIPAALFEGQLRYNLANTRWELMNPSPQISSAPFIDSTAIMKGSADATKLLKIEVDTITTGTTRTWTTQDANGTVAYVDSQTFTGTPTLPTGTIASTQTALDSTTKIATTAFVTTANQVLQQVRTETSAMATGTTAIPYDDTIPQITEGNEYMTLAITPKSATSKLVIQAHVTGSLSTGGFAVIALFQDSTANALAASVANGQPVNNQPTPIGLVHTMTSGTTSATTFRIRVGPSTGTYTFNGSAGTRTFGGVAASSILITEYAT